MFIDNDRSMISDFQANLETKYIPLAKESFERYVPMKKKVDHFNISRKNVVFPQ